MSLVADPPPFQAGTDLCIGFWAETWAAGVVAFPHGAQVLEVGCAEADWQTPMLACRPDLHITGIDWRDVERPGRFIRGNVLTANCRPATYDAIVSISAVEHIGLGAYEDDPLDPDGDTHCMERCAEWVKPGGWMYLDVPYRPTGSYSVNSNFRAYDEDALRARLLIAPFWARYRRVYTDRGADGPYIALVLERI